VTAVTPLTADAHVVVGDLDAPGLDARDQHHLVRVLRLRVGATVTVCDGQGRWRPCVHRGDGRLEVAGPALADVEPVYPVAVAFAPVKGDRPELIVQKLTELGVDVIVPIATERGVVRWEGERAQRHGERLRLVARDALMQCRRSRLPDVRPLTAVTDLLAAEPAWALADIGGAALDASMRRVVIGPEGGWTAGERESARATVTLGGHILRTETAAIAAATVLTLLRRRPEE
jgi:16S rRNA (uracil1498-N3)-methyltransferase